MLRLLNQAHLERLLHTDAVLSARLAVRDGLQRKLAMVVAHSGDSFLWILGAIAAFFWGGAAWPSFGLRTLVGTAASGMVSFTLKWLFRRSRPGGPPAGLYAPIDRHAFPSGHATRVGCMAVVLAPLLPGWGAGLLAAWAALVALARVSLRVHYLLDVTVGLVLGGLVGLGLLHVL